MLPDFEEHKGGDVGQRHEGGLKYAEKAFLVFPYRWQSKRAIYAWLAAQRPPADIKLIKVQTI